MKVILRLAEEGGVLALLALVSGRVDAQEFIDRQAEARGMFLATPQGIYGHYCAHCHGDEAKGDGRLWSSELSPTPTDLTALEASERDLAAMIRDGSAALGKSNLCPPWGRTLSPPDIERLAQYLVSLAGKTPAPPAPAARREPEREPFPWILTTALLGETVLLWRLIQRWRKTSNALS